MAGPLRITWLGHSTVVVDLGTIRLITDPLLGRHAGLLRRRGTAPDPKAWDGADAVLLSHLHHDHAELRSLRLLAGVPVITAPANAEWLLRKGVAGAVGLPDGEWVTVGADAQVGVRLTPAVHANRPMPHRPNAVNGHLIRAEAAVVWIAGDTELFAGMAELPTLAGAGVDVAVVPVAGWGPRLSAGHLDPSTAAQACDVVGARFAIPVHWGTLHPPAGRHLPLRWMDRAGPAFAPEVREHAPRCEPVALALGETWTAPELRPRSG